MVFENDSNDLHIVVLWEASFTDTMSCVKVRTRVSGFMIKVRGSRLGLGFSGSLFGVGIERALSPGE